MKTLLESLLDDNIFNDIDKAITIDWLKTNVKSDYKVKLLKTGELKVWGKLVIKDVDEFGWLNIARLEGDLYIEDCDIVNLNGIFADNARVTGNIYITGCKKLMDVSGLPRMVDGDVSITNCPALKELTGVDCFAGEVSIMRCGKRFKQNAVKKAFPTAIRVVCSEEEYEANLNEAIVNEAFQDPVLIRLYDQLRNLKKKIDLADMFGTYARLDKISPSQRETYKFSDQKPLLKAVRKIFTNRSMDRGFIVTEDWDGNFVLFFNNSRRVYWLKEGSFPGSYFQTDFQSGFSATDIIDMFKPGGDYTDNIKLVHIWFLDNDRYEIGVRRRKEKDGMIDPHDDQQMKRILQDQRDKYARAVKALKEARKSDEYKAIIDEVDKIMARFSKFMHKVISDPNWASANSWKFDSVFRSIRQGREDSGGLSNRRYGVIYAFQQWSGSVVRVLSQSEYSYGSTDPTMLKNAIAWADRELNAVGM